MIVATLINHSISQISLFLLFFFALYYTHYHVIHNRVSNKLRIFILSLYSRTRFAHRSQIPRISIVGFLRNSDRDRSWGNGKSYCWRTEVLWARTPRRYGDGVRGCRSLKPEVETSAWHPGWLDVGGDRETEWDVFPLRWTLNWNWRDRLRDSLALLRARRAPLQPHGARVRACVTHVHARDRDLREISSRLIIVLSARPTLSESDGGSP